MSAKSRKKSTTTVCLADVKSIAVQWLWKGFIPFGELSILEGDSDVGKSTVTLDLAAIMSTGRVWPATVIDGKTLISKHDPADVLLVGIEDDDSKTVVPRLIAAGADRNRVHSLKCPVNVAGQPQPFTIPNDIDHLRKAIIETGARLVFIDPITACLPEDTKHSADTSIRRILMSLLDLARERNCAIVLIRHFNKAVGMSAKHRGSGSIAYGALVRSVLQAVELPKEADDGATFALARAIGNLSKEPQTITYRLSNAPEMSELPKPEDDELRVSVVTWCGTSSLTADELIGADVRDARLGAPVREDAKDAIRDMLEDGPQNANDVILTVTQGVSCSKGTVKAAAKELKVIKRKVYVNGKIDHWTWELPPTVLNLSDFRKRFSREEGKKASDQP